MALEPSICRSMSDPFGSGVHEVEGGGSSLGVALTDGAREVFTYRLFDGVQSNLARQSGKTTEQGGVG